MKLPAQARPLPEYRVVIQGARRGSDCRVAVYRLVEFNDGLTWRGAEKWGRAMIENEELCKNAQRLCSLPSY